MLACPEDDNFAEPAVDVEVLECHATDNFAEPEVDVEVLADKFDFDRAEGK